MGVEATPDSGYLVVGFSKESVGPNHDPLIYKTDKTGNLLWGRRLNFPSSDDIIYACKGLPDGSSLVYGVTKTFLAIGELFLIKYDPSGNVVWLRTFKSPTNKSMWRGVSMDVGPDGFIYLAYSFYTVEFTQANGGVMKLSQDASTVIWSREMENAGNSIANGVKVTQNGSVLLLSTYGNNAPGGSSTDVAAVLFSPTGDMLWNLVLGGAANEYLFGAGQLSNGHYILSGYVFDFGANRNMLLVDLNPDGSFNWARTVDNSNDFGYSANEMPGNQIILYGTTDGGPVKGLWTVIYDFNGNLVQENGQPMSKVFTSGGDAASGFVDGLRILNNGQIAMIGSVISPIGYGGYDTFLNITNSISTSGCGLVVDLQVVAKDPNFIHVNNLITTNQNGLSITTRTAASVPFQVCVKDICNPQTSLSLQKPGKTFARCQGSTTSLVLDALNEGALYVWSTGETTKTITVNATGNYSVRITGRCDFLLDTFKVVISNPIKVEATYSPILCAEYPVQLTGKEIPGYVYKWKPGHLVSDSMTRVTNAVLLNTSETDTLVQEYFLISFNFNSPDCISNDTLQVKIPPVIPAPNLSGDTIFCLNPEDLIRYQLTGANGSTFEFGIYPELDIRLLNNNRYDISFPDTGTYQITYRQKNTAGCLSKKKVKTIRVIKNEEVSILTQDSVVTRLTLANASYTVNKPALGMSWKAIGASGISTSGEFLTVQWEQGQIDRKVMVEVRSPIRNCISRDTLLIRYKPLLFIPNLITPGLEDGNNDIFRIPDLEYFNPRELQLFNRWGKKVFHSDSYVNDWSGKELSTGMYFYLLHAGDKQFTGWLEISK